MVRKTLQNLLKMKNNWKNKVKIYHYSNFSINLPMLHIDEQSNLQTAELITSTQFSAKSKRKCKQKTDLQTNNWFVETAPS